MATEIKKDVVKIVKGKYAKTLIFFCPYCCVQHSLHIRMQSEKLPIQLREHSWSWNGSKTEPTVFGPECIVTTATDETECHCWIENGSICTDNVNYTPLLPVEEWLSLPPLESKKAFKKAKEKIKKEWAALNAKHGAEISKLYDTYYSQKCSQQDYDKKQSELQRQHMKKIADLRASKITLIKQFYQEDNYLQEQNDPN